MPPVPRQRTYLRSNLDVCCCGGGNQFSFACALEDLHEAGASYTNFDLAQAGALVFDQQQAVVDDGICRDEDDVQFFTADDIRLDAHPDPQRRVLGQADPDPERLCNGIAGRRDLLDDAGQHLTGERIGAQQRLLSDLNTGNVLLIDFGDDP